MTLPIFNNFGGYGEKLLKIGRTDFSFNVVVLKELIFNTPESAGNLVQWINLINFKKLNH